MPSIIVQYEENVKKRRYGKKSSIPIVSGRFRFGKVSNEGNKSSPEHQIRGMTFVPGRGDVSLIDACNRTRIIEPGEYVRDERLNGI